MNHGDTIFVGLAMRHARTSVNNGFWGKGVKKAGAGRMRVHDSKSASCLNHDCKSAKVNSGSIQARTNSQQSSDIEDRNF